MPNLRGLLDTALSSHLPSVLINGLIVVLSLALIYFVSLKWKAVPGDVDLGYSLCLVSSILTSYHCYVYDLSFLFLASLLVANHGILNSAARWKAVKLYAPVLLLFLTPLQMLLQLRYDQFYLFALVLILWGWGIAEQMAPIGGAAVNTAGSREMLHVSR